MIAAEQAELWRTPLESVAVVAVPEGSGSFLHCCSREQLPGVLDRYFADIAVVVVRLSAAELAGTGARVEWECGVDPATGAIVSNELFPHVYGSIPGALVREMIRYPAGRS